MDRVECCARIRGVGQSGLMAGEAMEVRIVCIFDEIEKLDRYIYYVRGKCKSNTPSNMTSNIPNEGLQAWHSTPTSIYTEMRELHFVDGALVMWDLPEV